MNEERCRTANGADWNACTPLGDTIEEGRTSARLPRYHLQDIPKSRTAVVERQLPMPVSIEIGCKPPKSTYKTL